MRKAIAALLLALLIPVSVLPAAAGEQTVPDTVYTAVIEDAANLLDPAEYDSVLAEMTYVTQYCNAGLYTCRDGSSRYSLTKAEEWARSHFPSGKCTVMIIDMTNRHLDIWSSDDGVFQVITTDAANTITDNVYRSATKGNYADCAREAFRQIYALLDGQQIAEPMRYISCALIAAAAALLLAYLVISARMEQEVKVSLPEVATLTAGAGAAIVGKKLVKVVHHESSGGHGGFGGGGGGGGGGGFGGGGGGHGF